MSKFPLVSVIIPTYNRAYVVHKAIESVLAQTYKNIEIIVGNLSGRKPSAAPMAALGRGRHGIARRNGVFRVR